jgi:hypothetical protein
MLENLIKKYREKDIEGIIYRLSYAGKFIIIKGKTLAGSLIIINDTFKQFSSRNKRFIGHLYRHLYNHYRRHPKGRFTVKVLAKINSKTTHYDLLKREQMELDRHRYNKKCLNNALNAYIPLYNDTTDAFGWLEKSAVMNFKRYLASKARKAYVKRYSKKPAPTPARSGL